MQGMAQGNDVLIHNYSVEIHAEKQYPALRNSDLLLYPISQSLLLCKTSSTEVCNFTILF